MKLHTTVFLLSLAACSRYESPEFNSRAEQSDVDETEIKDATPLPAEETREQAVEVEDVAVNMDEEEAREEVDTPQIRTSNGSGGPTGMNEVAFTDSNNVSSSYKINAPEDAGEKIYGLHIHFHGDGGGGYRDFPNQETRYGLIGVTVKAPNQNLQWGRAEGEAHANYAQELIQNEILKKYNIDLDKVYFSGVSGGAYFLSGSFLPEFASQYKSGAFFMCGGEAPRVDIKNPETLKEFRIHWQVTAGERADITASVQRSVQAYGAALNAVQGDAGVQSIETKGTGGHCEFFEMPYTPGIQAMVDANFKLILPAAIAVNVQ